MLPGSEFGFQLMGIADVLKLRQLAVPRYQRAYAWGGDEAKDHVEEFWEDLHGTFVRPQQEYFLGTVVLSKEGVQGRDTIIDGQQRLATTAILLAAIRNEFRDRGDTEPADTIHGDYLARRVLRARSAAPQLQLNSEDDTYFRRVIVENDDPNKVDATQPSHWLILDALNTLRDRVKKAADDVGSSWPDRLMDWVEFLADRVRVIVVEVPTEADAFLIFETLNDRGADLTIADLLKNYLFSHAGQRLTLVRDKWMLALGALEIDAGSTLFTNFLRHYWSSRRGATRERELYRSIREAVANEAQAVELAENLSKAARLYAAILSSDHEFWSEQATVTKGNLDTLRRLDLEQNRPLLLAALQHFTKPELRKLMKALVSWSVRGLIVGGIGGGVYERRYCAAATKIRNGDITTTAQLFTELQTIVPSDEEFEKAFAIARVTKGTLARYYLTALERESASTKEAELVPNEDEEQLNLEHVLPKSPSSGWAQFNADERKAYVNRLGNMVLLQKSKNNRIGNKPFVTKKPILTASELNLTKQAATESEWTPKVIENRQATLASLAVKTWPRKA